MSRRGILLIIILTGVGFMLAGSWIHIKAEVAQWLLADAWQQTKSDGQAHKPWAWADHWPVARLRVQKLKIDQIVLAGDTGNVLAFAPGHNQQSASPGDTGIVVISGHRDTHFRFLKDLSTGDEIEIETPSRKIRYRVADDQIVDSTVTSINPKADERQLLLVTCYPFDSPVAGGPLRYLVMANEIEI